MFNLLTTSILVLMTSLANAEDIQLNRLCGLGELKTSVRESLVVNESLGSIVAHSPQMQFSLNQRIKLIRSEIVPLPKSSEDPAFFHSTTICE